MSDAKLLNLYLACKQQQLCGPRKIIGTFKKQAPGADRAES